MSAVFLYYFSICISLLFSLVKGCGGHHLNWLFVFLNCKKVLEIIKVIYFTGMNSFVFSQGSSQCEWKPAKSASILKKKEKKKHFFKKILIFGFQLNVLKKQSNIVLINTTEIKIILTNLINLNNPQCFYNCFNI